MPASETFAQFDADMQALIAEVETISPPVAMMGRRSFLKLATFAGGGLVLAFRLDTRAALAEDSSEADASNLNAFVRVTPENTVILYSKGPEIGQGIKTAFGLIIAEELDADWNTVKVDQAPINSKVYGYQGAGGSTSIPRAWDQLRQAGATARAMLIAAAAKEWKVPVSECSAAASVVTHTPSGRKLSYGALAKAASAQPVPDPTKVQLKSRAEYKLLGKRFTGVDNLKVVTGQPLFGIDVQMPGMLYANYIMCPAVGGKVKSANLDEIKKMPGVVDAFVLDGTGTPAEVMPGVAVIAKSTWEAFKAKAALKVDWDESSASKDSLTQAAIKAKEIGAQMPAPANNVGDVDTAFGSAAKVVEASYDYAMVSHQQLEPQNSTAWWHDGIMEIWTPTQQADRGLAMVAKMLNLPDEKVTVHQMRAGGGFGRRLANDYMCEAAAIAMKVNAPVKLQWKREDDFAHDFFRAGGYHFLKGAVDKTGKLSAIQNHLVSFSADGSRPVSGGARSNNSFPTDMAPNVRYAVSLMPLQIPCGPWRAPTDNVQMFVAGSFLHELSVAAGRDHVEFLLEWFARPLAKSEGPPPDPSRSYNASRAAGVLKMAAEKSGWGKKLPSGRGLGIAFSCAYGGHVAETVELSVDAQKHVTVHKIIVVADIGPVINMSGAENQAQGGAIDALSTAMGLEIEAEQGRIKQTNFTGYPILRMPSAPPVDVHFIQSDFRPAGLGEPCVPPLAAALGNAIFAATGERVRTMPFKRAGYTI
ncbi:xanthine dehydrogenase family protein molybdopterin-binding subunit [Acidipila rosea]|uniref:Isoquinoline 1-oxidoreductase beta subunit n=1 Tax=Acidipila rosea TaxID=768535 RepID=A0A4R1LB05_9BACT|nr:molybdopterin cofactor-binding domain-containing protein [Acidipila rosea]TCK75648.1 isoquinoline 1-oxidoreductase beta subunit [Acidipila rosea]